MISLFLSGSRVNTVFIHFSRCFSPPRTLCFSAPPQRNYWPRFLRTSVQGCSIGQERAHYDLERVWITGWIHQIIFNSCRMSRIQLLRKAALSSCSPDTCNKEDFQTQIGPDKYCTSLQLNMICVDNDTNWIHKRAERPLYNVTLVIYIFNTGIFLIISCTK